MATSSTGKRKRKRLTGRKFERCGNKADAVEPDYHTTFCVHVYCLDGLNRWYVLDVSSYKDRRKEDLEKQPLILDTSTSSPDLYLAFNHSDRHSESAEDRPTLLPLLSEKKSNRFGTCHAVVGTTLYRFGGATTKRLRGDLGGSRKLFFLDSNLPEEWRKGPQTIAGRYMAATVSIFGKLFVFGGCPPNNGVWAEVLDTARAADADNGGWRWSPLPGGSQCPSDVLGVEDLFAIAIYHGKYAGNILVGSKMGGNVFLYDVANEIWQRVESDIDFDDDDRFFTHPVVVGSMLYWISVYNQDLRCFDLEELTLRVISIADTEICKQLHVTLKWDVDCMNPNFIHLTGDIFCLMWVGGDGHLHTTTLKVSATMASVVCCHTYSFQEQDDQEQDDDQDDCFAGNIELVECLQPSLQM